MRIMNNRHIPANKRILVIDDNQAIHESGTFFQIFLPINSDARGRSLASAEIPELGVRRLSYVILRAIPS